MMFIGNFFSKKSPPKPARALADQIIEAYIDDRVEVSPEEYVRLIKKSPVGIESAKFVLPKGDSSGFGTFVVKLNRPRLITSG